MRRVLADVAGITEAVRILRAGGLVALPTETFYGLAAALDRPAALARLSRLKERPADSPLPLLVRGTDGPAGLTAVAREVNPRIEELIRRFWPGPLTLVLPARPGLPPEVVGPDGTVGVRWSPDPVLEPLLAELGVPVTATSANPRGAPPPRTADQTAAGLDSAVDLLLDGGPRPGGRPSTLVRPAAAGPLTLVRRGCLPLPLLEQPDRYSLDALRRGRVQFLQPRARGLRVNLDPVLLAWWLRDRIRDGPVVDLGTGVGILPLLLAAQGVAGPCQAVELDPELAGLARENVLHQGLLPERVMIHQADLRALDGLLPAAGAAWVLSNPPQQRVSQGRVSPDPLRAQARTELTCTLAELVAAAARLLRPAGHCALVQRGDREAETRTCLAAVGLTPVRGLRVLPRPNSPPRRVLLEAARGPGAAFQQEPDLILHEADGRYTAPLRSWLEGED